MRVLLCLYKYHQETHVNEIFYTLCQTSAEFGEIAIKLL